MADIMTQRLLGRRQYYERKKDRTAEDDLVIALIDEHIREIAAREPRKILASQAVPQSHHYLEELHARFYDLGRTYGSLGEKAEVLASIGALPKERAAERVLKTVYFQTARGRIYGAVLPADQRVDVARLKEVIRKDDGPFRHRMDLRKAGRLPHGMRPGSCGPFPSAEDYSPARSGLERIYLDGELNAHQRYDFAVPGNPDISLVARLSDVYEFVNDRFDGVLQFAPLRVDARAGDATPYTKPEAPARVVVPSLDSAVFA